MNFILLPFFGIFAWRCPVLGLGFFMISQTPLGNVASPICHPYTWAAFLVPAGLRLVRRRIKCLNGEPLRGVELCALVFSVVVLFREYAMLDSSYNFTKLGLISVMACMWGPLLMALNALDEKEISELRLWMSVSGIVIGVWGTLIYLTGSSYLMQKALFDPNSVTAMRALENEEPENIVAGRFVIMGLFTICPYAYWYVLRGAIATTKQHWVWSLSMWTGIGAILLAVGISVTRSALLLMVIGSFVMLITLAQINRGMRVNRKRLFSIVAVGVCLIGIMAYRIDVSPIIEQYNMRFSMLGDGDTSIAGRLYNTNNALAYIEQTLCLFGAPNPDSIASCDTAVFLRIWLYYGVLGAILFSMLFIAAFWNLFKCWLSQQLNPENQLLCGMLTAWALTYVYIWIVGYSLQLTEIFFTMLFFSEIIRLNDNRLSLTSLQTGRIAQ